jgi:hypothetical protein
MEEFSEVLDELEDQSAERADRSDAQPKPEHPPKIVFDQQQQEKVNQLIREAQGRAARETRAELARVQAELDAARAVSPALPDSGAAVLATELAAARAELQAVKQREVENTLNTQLLSAAAAENFHSVEIATRLMRDHVRLVDGKVSVVDHAGNERLNAGLDPMTLEDFAREISQQHPYLTRSQVRSGAGSVESRGYKPSVQLEKLFGRGAAPDAARVLNDLAKRDSAKYRSLRNAARERGLIH